MKYKKTIIGVLVSKLAFIGMAAFGFLTETSCSNDAGLEESYMYASTDNDKVEFLTDKKNLEYAGLSQIPNFGFTAPSGKGGKSSQMFNKKLRDDKIKEKEPEKILIRIINFNDLVLVLRHQEDISSKNLWKNRAEYLNYQPTEKVKLHRMKVKPFLLDVIKKAFELDTALRAYEDKIAACNIAKCKKNEEEEEEENNNYQFFYNKKSEENKEKGFDFTDYRPAVICRTIIKYGNGEWATKWWNSKKNGRDEFLKTLRKPEIWKNMELDGLNELFTDMVMPHQNHFGTIEYCIKLVENQKDLSKKDEKIKKEPTLNEEFDEEEDNNKQEFDAESSVKENYMIAIKLRPFAQAFLLNPYYSVLPFSNNEHLHYIAKLAFQESNFFTGSESEGNAKGFIGLKPEMDIFSLCFGRNLAGKILLSTIVDELYVEKVIVKDGSNLLNGDQSQYYMSLTDFRKEQFKPKKENVEHDQQH